MELIVTLPLEAAKLLQELTRKLERGALYSQLFKFFGRVAQRAAGYIVQTKLSGQVLMRRTGSLARAIVGFATYDERGLPGFRVGVLRGPATQYAAAQEHGAHIVPVRAKYLAMPVGEALTGAGVARWGSPRDFPGRLVFIPFRNSGVAVGALYDAASLQRRGRGKMDLSSARKLWVLLKKMDIPAHHYLRNGVREFIPRIAGELAAFLRTLMSEAKRAGA